MPNDKAKRLPADEDDEPKLADDSTDEALWEEEEDPADRRRDPLRKPQ